GHLLEGLQEDRGKAERRVRELALGRGERWHGEERPVDQAVRGDERETLGHLTSIAARRSEASGRGRTRPPRTRRRERARARGADCTEVARSRSKSGGRPGN